MFKVKCIYSFYLICFLCLWGTCGHAATQVSQSEYALFTAAKKALDTQNYASVADSLAAYFRSKGTKHEYGYELYGIVLLNTQQYQRAVQVLAEGFKAYPKNANLAQNLGMAYHHTKQTLKAAQAFEAAFALTKGKSPSLAYTAGHFYVLTKQYKKAIALLKPLIQSKSVKVLWFQVLAQAYLGNGQGGQAIATLEKGLSKFRENASLWRMLGYAHYRLKQTEKAAAAYEIAYKIFPASSAERKQLAGLYYSLYAPYSGKRMAALASTTPETLDYVSVLLAQAGDYSAAIEVASLAVQKKYSDTRQFRLGQMLRRKNSLAQASKVFTGLAQKKGAYAERAQWMLAEMAWEKKDWKGLAVHLRALESQQGSMAAMATQLLNTVDQLAKQELTAYTNKDKNIAK